MKPSVIFLLVILASPIIAQPAAGNSTNVIGSPYNKSDTLRALENFNKRLHRNIRISSALEVVGLSAAIISVSTSDKHNGAEYFFAGALTGSLIVNALLLKRFSKKNFSRITQDYQSGKKLPDQIISRLKEKDFK